FSSVQVEGLADMLTVEHPPEPGDLVGGFEERVVAVDGRVPGFDGVLDLADRRGGDLPDPTDVERDELEPGRIDLALLDEPAGLLRAPARVGRVHQPALAVHEVVEVAAGAGEGLAEVVGSDLQDLAANGVTDAEDLAEGENQPLPAVQT